LLLGLISVQALSKTVFQDDFNEAVLTSGIHIWMGGTNALFDSSWNTLPAMDAF